LAQFKEHRAVFFVIVVVATVNNLENIFKWERDANGFEVVFAKIIAREVCDVVGLSSLLIHPFLPIFGYFV